jgi:hypothetical protein
MAGIHLRHPSPGCRLQISRIHSPWVLQDYGTVGGEAIEEGSPELHLVAHRTAQQFANAPAG